jgi:hypothetical protein
MDCIAQTARTAINEGHFRKGADVEQFASELYGVMLACHHASRLMRDPKAEERARRAFESLLSLYRAPSA